MQDKTENTIEKTQTGNVVVIVLVVLVLVAVGALAFLSGQLAGEKVAGNDAANNTSQGENVAQNGDQKTDEFVVKPGNPVVAKIGEEDIKRDQVLEFIKNLPEQARAVPGDQLFNLAVNQIVNERLLDKQLEKVDLTNDETYKEQIKQATTQIKRAVFLQNKIEEKITEDKLKSTYEQYKASFPQVEEVKAAHILVDDKETATDLIKQLKEGGDFASLAQEHSKDATAANGGTLGYFTRKDVVPEFADVAFSIAPGSYTPQPVETQFGWHIVKVEDKRMREPVDYDTAKPLLETQLRQQSLTEVIEDFRENMSVEVYNINGDPIEQPSETSAMPLGTPTVQN